MTRPALARWRALTLKQRAFARRPHRAMLSALIRYLRESPFDDEAREELRVTRVVLAVLRAGARK